MLSIANRLGILGWLMLAVMILFGFSAGVGGYTFLYANGASYLSNDPSACANCHIMNDNYNAWQTSSHHTVATCNDCHAPHDSVIHKYYVKGVNGFNHSLAFTTGIFPDPIRITEFNRKVTEQTCRDCHQQITHDIDLDFQVQNRPEQQMSCIRCHAHVGH